MRATEKMAGARARCKWLAGLLALVLCAGVLLAGCGGNVQQPLRLGEQYLLEGKYEEALLQFLQVIEIDPSEPQGYSGAGNAYLALGQNAEAVAVLEQGVAATGDAELQEMLEKARLIETHAAYLAAHADALLALLDAYKVGAYTDAPLQLLDDVRRGVRAAQDSDEFRAVVDALYQHGDGELQFMHRPDVFVGVKRGEEDGVQTYHFDIFAGEDGTGYFLGSRCGGSSLYTLHIAPYIDGQATGTNRDTTFRTDREYVKQMELDAGNAYGEIRYFYSTGEVPTKGTESQSNWWPGWPAPLQQ